MGNSYELESKLLTGGFIRDHARAIKTTIGVIKGDTWSLDCSSYRAQGSHTVRTRIKMNLRKSPPLFDPPKLVDSRRRLNGFGVLGILEELNGLGFRVPPNNKPTPV